MRGPTSPSTTERVSNGTDSLALLTFKVARQEYGLPVTSVVRIIEMVTITHLPGVPDMIQGIINLHGRAVPVMDLRYRFGLSPEAYGLHTPIILVDIANGDRIMGLVADTVEQVINAPAHSLELTETIVPVELAGQMASSAAYLAGVAKIDRSLILVLDVRALLTPKEQVQLAQALEHEAIG